MKLNIEIETNDRMLTSDLFESREFSAGQTEKVITEGISIRWEGGLKRKAVGFPEIVRITLFIAEKVVLPVAISLTAKWLYDKLKGRTIKKITIEKTEVTLDKGEIKKIITEKMQEEE